MAKKINQALSEGPAQPEIRKGSKWRDSRGDIVTIEDHRFSRVTFTREGYSFPCVQPHMRFLKEFTLVKQLMFSQWCRDNKTAEKIQTLRAMISEARAKK